MDFGSDDEDAILAMVLEDSLKHYVDHELSRGCNKAHGTDGNGSNDVVELNIVGEKQDNVSDGKKNTEVQTNIAEDKIWDKENKDNNDVELSQEIRNLPAIGKLYAGSEAEGFDLSYAGEWIYPINYPVREYQKNIVAQALFKNTLVCLPTGLGKTFIAAVVMYNYHRWYPRHKVVFMAHSKPLVTQQVHACCHIMGISPAVIAELNGSQNSSNRKIHWESKKIFFLTPQVFNNDLAKRIVSPESIRCVVVDEAHKALGNQAYCQVMRSIKPFNVNFRVLALSATPGDDMNTVKQVIENLMISHLEIRNEDNPDVKPYLFEKKIETIVVKLDEKILKFKDQCLQVISKYVTPLIKQKLVPQSFGALNSFSLVLKQKQFIADPNVPAGLRGSLLSNFSVAISLFKSLEELTTHGLRSFLNKLLNMRSGEGSTNKVHFRVANDDQFNALIKDVEEYIGPDKDIPLDPNTSITKLFDDVDSISTEKPKVFSHPKFSILSDVITKHFESYQGATKVIVFCKSRPCTGEICNLLGRFRPVVKPMIFIGQSQSNTGSTTKGFNQATQLIVMKKFREGTYNTLVATCVAEEGLDIGEVDLIINFDSGKNSNTQVQRSGRTGRKREGRVVNLVTEGKEQQNYNVSISKAKTINKKLADGLKNLPLFMNNPSLLPKNVKPKCHEMHLVSSKEPKIAPQPTAKRKTKTEDKKKPKSDKREADDLDNKPALKRKKSKTEVEITEPFELSQPKVLNKYDIRYAMQVAVEKNKNQEVSSQSETSSSAFQPVTAFDLLKKTKSNAKANKKSTKLVNQVNRGKTDEIEVIDLLDESNKPSLPIYNEDVMEGNTNPLESPILNALHAKEKIAIISFFKNYEIRTWKKTDVSKLIDLDSLAIFLPKESNSFNPMAELRKYSNVRLNVDNFKNEKLWRSVIEAKLCDVTVISNPKKTPERNDSPVKVEQIWEKEDGVEKAQIAVKEDDLKNAQIPVKEEILKTAPVSPEVKDEFNLDIGMFASPIVCSTPIKVKPSIPVANFDLWNDDDDDFFVLADSPKKPTPVKKNKGTHDDTAMITISQALNLVDSHQTQLPVKAASPCLSPVLFSSQKPKSATRFPAQSPILSQRKKPKMDNRKGKVVEKLNFSPVGKRCGLHSEEDIFAETEAEIKKYNAVQENEHEKSFDSDCTVVYDLEADKEKENKENSIGDLETNLSLFNVYKTPEFKSSKLAVVRPLGFETRQPSDNTTGWVMKKSKQPAKLFTEKKKNKKPEEEFSVTKASESAAKSITFAPTFDCMPDDLFDTPFDLPPEKEKTTRPDESDDSFGVFCKKRGGKNALVLNESDHSAREASKTSVIEIPDGDLSDGALEAIRLVSEFERKNSEPTNRNFTKKASQSRHVFNNSEDSDDEFFLTVKQQSKKKSQTVAKVKPIRVENRVEKPEASNQYKRPKNAFIEDEADLSGNLKVSSDEENTSGLDEYDSSFVDEREMLTQAPDVDMTAKYLQSTKGSLVGGSGAFKIPKPKVPVANFDVFSQIDPDTDVGYVNVRISEQKYYTGQQILDSFCVDESEGPSVHDQEMSALEIAEIMLEKEKKERKRKRKEEDIEVKQKPKHRRILTHSDSSSDEEQEKRKEPGCVSEYFNSENQKKPVENSKIFVTKDSTSICQKKPFQPVVFIASRQIASAPEITTALRAKWKVQVHVRSLPGADFIVSWRMGVNRILLSDFANGSQSSKTALKENTQKLRAYFRKPVYLIEDDKNKGLPLTVGCHKTLWSKHSYETLVKLREANVVTVFSRNKDDTARILMEFVKEETTKGFEIKICGSEIPAQLETKMSFYCSLPGINVANALRLTQKFLSVGSFINRCDNVATIQSEIDVDKETALKIYNVLYNLPVS